MFLSGAEAGKFITFMTAQYPQTQNPAEDNSVDNDTSGLCLWRFGRNRESNPLVFEKITYLYEGYQVSSGEMSEDGYGDIFFNDHSVGVVHTYVASVAQNNSVQYFVFAHQKASPDTDSGLESFTHPLNSRVISTNYHSDGSIVTQEIGREVGEKKVLERVGIRAKIAENTQVKVSVAVDGSDAFTEVAVFEPLEVNTQWVPVGDRDIGQFHTFQLKVELVSTDNLGTPVLYGIMAEYDVQSDVG